MHQVLRLSERGAYNRIEAARTARKFPIVLDLLEQGALNLATLRLVAPQLTPENHGVLLEAASYKSKREVEELLARLFPRADVAASVRKLPDARPSTSGRRVQDATPEAPTVPVRVGADQSCGVAESMGSMKCSAAVEGAAGGDPCVAAVPPSPRPSPRSSQHPVVVPLSSDRYQIRFTASASTCEKLRRAQDLLRHAVPDGDPAEIFDRALTALLGELGRRKFGATGDPREGRRSTPGSRRVPAAVRRAVMARDRGQCAFVAEGGRKCGATAFVEFHHVIPYARGGQATMANIQLRCRAHNGYEAELDFGPELVPGRVRSAQRQVDRPADVLAGAAFEGHP